jgi:anti-sigma B factor antagonist
MDLELSSRTEGDVTTLMVSGELDVASQPQLAEAISELRHTGHTHVVVDLENLAFLDSTGIGTLVTCAMEAEAEGGWIRVEHAHGMPRRALQITGVLDLLSGPNVDGAAGCAG